MKALRSLGLPCVKAFTRGLSFLGFAEFRRLNGMSPVAPGPVAQGGSRSLAVPFWFSRREMDGWHGGCNVFEVLSLTNKNTKWHGDS